MIKILHLSDIHMGSGFNHGRINPETGLNTRLEDFIAALRQCIDRAIAEPVDLVLFGGDAFPNATPLPIVQEAFACQFRRLVDGGIPAVLLVGNHDQHSQGEGGDSLCIYRTLGVPGFWVGDRLKTHCIPTAHGTVQVITLPWLTRSTLLTRPETDGLSLSDIHHRLIERLALALEGEIRGLNPHLPTILLAHAMVDTATFGAERFLAVGKGFTLPLSLFTRDCFDYVALGHVHRHQILCQNPPVVYPGSIERVDFSEENETKGFVMVELEKGEVKVEFCPLTVRPFRTIDLDVTQSDTPQSHLLAALDPSHLHSAIVRLVYRLKPSQLEQIDNHGLKQALSNAHSFTIQPQLVSQLTRPRIPNLGINTSTDPIAALHTYLHHREDLQDIAQELISTAQQLLHQDGWWNDQPPEQVKFLNTLQSQGELGQELTTPLHDGMEVMEPDGVSPFWTNMTQLPLF